MRLVASSLTSIRNGRRVFADVSFALGAGELMTLTGPNGAGKSTLLRIIAGLLHPSAGTIAIEGGTDEASIGEEAHYVGHQEGVKNALTAAENLAFWAAMLGGAGKPVVEALAVLGLDHLADVPAGYLSAGQRRRLALARLVASPRPLWLLDEPLTAIDAASAERLQALIASHLSAGGLVVAATHAPIGLEPAQTLTLGSMS